MSLGDFQIKEDKERLVSEGKWIEVDELPPSGEKPHRPDSNLLVGGDLPSGTRILSKSVVIVEGDMNGEEDAHCYVFAEGDVIVEGNVHHTTLKGQNIRIGGEARCCKMDAVENIEVGGEASEANFSVGNFDTEKRTLTADWLELQRLQKKCAFNEREYGMERRRIPRQIERTKFSLDYSFGQVVQQWVVQHSNKEIGVDLKPLYKVLEGKSETDIDLALKEFFAGGIVTTLVRVNQPVIELNPNRRKVFMGTIRSLEELFWLVRDIDKQKSEIGRAEESIETILDHIENFSGGVYIQGAIQPEVNVEYHQPIVSRKPGEKAEIQDNVASYHLSLGQETTVEQTSIQGETRESEVNSDELGNCRFDLDTDWLERTDIK